jgi:hypothetical protein
MAYEHVGRRARPWGRCMSIAILVALICAVAAQSAGAAPGSAHRLGYALSPSKTTPYTPCPPGGRMIECNIVVDPPAVKTSHGYRLPAGGPLLEGGGELGGFDPKDLQSAYSIPTTGGEGETVALVDAYGYAAAESDLAKYREKYGLAACTKANGCFKKVNEKGEEKNYPAEGGEVEKEWSLESALDLDMVSAACPSCHITLVEATTQEPKDTAASAEEAATLGAKEISNSYGYPENNETWCPEKKGCKEYLAKYDHAGVVVTVSSGDSGYDDGVGAPSWPATSPNVVAVGGTDLYKAENSRGWRETAWADSGSGCSLYESKPAWQTDTGCANRTDNDVAAVADPNTPVSIYNTPYASGWFNVGGTSVASPLVAAIEAHANSTTKSAGAEAFYKHPGMLYDITEGSNGSCEKTYLCKAGLEYDGPTGWGTPDGVPRVTGWFTRATPNLGSGVVDNGSLADVSCTSAEVCTGVGYYVKTAGVDVPLAERWNGKEWSLQAAVAPGGAKSSTLTSVSCNKENIFVYEYCIAVGHDINHAGAEAPFAEVWNPVSGEWYLDEVPLPSGAKSGGLASLSCRVDELAVVCNAAGHDVNSGGTEVALAEKWNGSSWSLLEAPNPAEAKSSSLAGISCLASEEACMAVGHYVNAAGTEVTLSEVFDGGTKLTIYKTPNPAGAKSSSLSGVSCNSLAACIAVGHYVTSGGVEETLAEQWTLGKTEFEWLLQEPPNPTGAKSSSLSGVSCASSAVCTAVGHYVNSGGTEVTLAEAYAEKKWATQETANPSGAKSSSLLGVSCVTTEACTAMGHSVNSKGAEQTLGEAFASKKWSIKETPDPKEPSGGLPGISCTSSEACTAVGHALNSTGTEVTLAERWNGKVWALQEPANPAEAKSSSLTAVSCASSTVCTAVGHYVNSAGKELPLAEGWNGTAWSIQETPVPAEAKSGALLGVSCASTTVCTAVGHYVSSAGKELTLAEGWASSKWSIQESLNPAEAKSASLSGVSCASTTVCTAVGHYVSSASKELTLAEGWASSKWSIQESLNPAEAKSASLSGVSCASTTVCTAVGHYVSSASKELTLAEGWASSKWSIQESLNPAEAKSASLSGVSCASTEACTAVGHYANSAGVELTLAEAWASSKWSIEASPNPAEAADSSLSGVSCKETTTCRAAGSYLTGASSPELPFAEEHA